MQLFGAAPEPGEHDPREVWGRDEAICVLAEAFWIVAQGVAYDSFPVAGEREHLL